jgi:hypothetical protein
MVARTEEKPKASMHDLMNKVRDDYCPPDKRRKLPDRDNCPQIIPGSKAARAKLKAERIGKEEWRSPDWKQHEDIWHTYETLMLGESNTGPAEHLTYLENQVLITLYREEIELLDDPIRPSKKTKPPAYPGAPEGIDPRQGNAIPRDKLAEMITVIRSSHPDEKLTHMQVTVIINSEEIRERFGLTEQDRYARYDNVRDESAKLKRDGVLKGPEKQSAKRYGHAWHYTRQPWDVTGELDIRTCWHCDAPLTGKNRDSRYCSDKCRKAHGRRVVRDSGTILKDKEDSHCAAIADIAAGEGDAA